MIQLDTPGGLEKSMRLIAQRILNAEVPVVVYVAPTGARAASAGVFITLAAHVAAMAPATNIGAAHPVAMGGNVGQGEPAQDRQRCRRLHSHHRRRTRPQRRLGREGGARVGVDHRTGGPDAFG